MGMQEGRSILAAPLAPHSIRRLALHTHGHAHLPGKPCKLWPGLGYMLIKVVASESGLVRALAD